MKRTLATVLGLGLGLLPLPSHAGMDESGSAQTEKDRPSLLVLPLKVDGAVPRRVRDRYQSSALDKLQSGNYRLELAEECATVECAAQKFPDANRPVVLRQVLSAKERNYTLKVELIEVATGQVLSTSTESCELCGVGEVTELFTARAAVVKNKLESANSFGSVLMVNSDPPGAEIFVDGQLMGKTPSSLSLRPGKHSVELRKKGHLPSRKALSVVDGVRETLEFQLSEIRVAPTVDEKSRRGLIRMAGWGWLSLGVGVAGLATGTTLMVLHDRPYKSSCDPQLLDRDKHGNCRYLYDTQKGGIIGLSVGGAFALAGVAMVVLAPKWEAKQAQKKLVLRPFAQGLRLSF